MTNRDEWKTLLMPWAERFANLHTDVQAHCVSLSDADLAKLETATRQPTQTNAWWATYGVREIVRKEVVIEQGRRRGLAAS